MICLDPIIDGDEIRNLKCSHCFHSKCVDIWLLGTLSDESLNTSICPTCRQEAISDHISVDSSVDSPSQLCSQDSTNSQTILAPKPIYLPPQSTAPSSKAVSEISSNSSYDTGSNVGFRPQDSDIPREVFMRVGQYLLDEEQINDTPSPLMSPAPARSPDVLSNFSYSSPIRPSIPQGIIEDQVLSRSSSFSSVSSSHSSSSSFLSVQNSNHSESGVYINFSVLSHSLDILSIASGE